MKEYFYVIQFISNIFSSYTSRWLNAVIFISVLITYTQKKNMQQHLFAYIFGKYVAPGMAKRLEPHKKQLFSTLHTMISHDPKLKDLGPGGIRILEIGVGSGTNLKYYPNNCRLITVEPNSYFRGYFDKNREEFPNITIEQFVIGNAENLIEIEENSVDVVVSTLVLCSVTNLVTVLKEIKRILCTGGKFYYLEHIGYESNSWSYFIQKMIEPMWRAVSDGCSLTAPISKCIKEAGFTSVQEKEIMLFGEFFVVRRNVLGVATV